MQTVPRWIAGPLLGLAVWAAAAGLVGAQPIDVVPPQDRLVNDRAGMLSSTEVQQLEQKLRGYADTTSTQIEIGRAHV